jgi:hypothetical protein
MADVFKKPERVVFPESNEAYGVGMGKIWDKREPMKGWQRVKGGIRVVSAKIPSPVATPAPAWSGWRGVLSEDGRVFDYETGRELRKLGTTSKPAVPPGSRLKK